MATDPRSPPSNYPPAMGPGARPTKSPGEIEKQKTLLMQVMEARAKYQVSVEPETLSLSYEANGAPRLFRLSFDSIPLQGFSRWWLYGGSVRSRRAGVLAIDIIRGSEKVAKRPVTQTEAESLTYWASQRLLYGSFSTALGISLGLYLARRGHVKMKFPIFPAKPLERYNAFPLQRVPIFTGKTAQGAWQFARYMIWIEVAIFCVSPLVTTVGTFRVANGMANDPRTQSLVHVLKEHGQTDIGSIRPPGQQQPQQSLSQAWPQDQAQDISQASQPDFEPDARDQAAYQTSQREATDGAAYQNQILDPGISNGLAMRDSDRRSDYGGFSSVQQPQRQVEPTRPSRSGSSDPFFYDDASTTAGSDYDNASPTAYNAPSGGSVWDRIRRGKPESQPRSSQPTRAPEPRPSRSADQYADQGQQGAYGNEGKIGMGGGGRDREQAQQEFDQMLERERQQSGSDEYDRDMRAVEQGQQGGNSAGGGGSAWERRRGD